MSDVWDRWGYVLVTSVLALPVLVAVVAARARRVGWRFAIGEVGAVAGTAPFVWMVLTPRVGYRNLHLDPFQEVPWYLGLDPVTASIQFFGNLAVFAAFGAAAPIRWRIGMSVIAGAAFAASIGVETAQYLLDIGRTASTADVLLNATGAVLSALVTRRWWRIRARTC